MNTELKTVLVVEDERPLLEAIKLKLEKNGFSVVTARNVEQARDYLEEIESIQLIWLDHYLLGKESGLDLFVELKSDESKWKHLPVFVVSNTVSDEKIQSYLKLGAEKYYVKSTSRLKGIVEDIIEHLGDKKTSG